MGPARSLDHPAPGDITLDEVLSALADPVRRSIVQHLAAAPQSQACSAFDLPVAKSTSTHHFRVLRESGVIFQQYQGTAIHSTLRSDDLNARFPGLLDAIISAA